VRRALGHTAILTCHPPKGLNSGIWLVEGAAALVEYRLYSEVQEIGTSLVNATTTKLHVQKGLVFRSNNFLVVTRNVTEDNQTQVQLGRRTSAQLSPAFSARILLCKSTGALRAGVVGCMFHVRLRLALVRPTKVRLERLTGSQSHRRGQKDVKTCPLSSRTR
jgi:hypothetical protein